MPWLIYAFSGPVLWALSTHIDKYLVERYFKQGSVAVLMVFTAIIGGLALPFIWLFQPGVVSLDPQSMAVIAVSGILYMGAIYFYLEALQAEEASTVAPFFQAAGIYRADTRIFCPWRKTFHFANYRRFIDHCRIGSPFLAAWPRCQPH